MSLQRFSLYFLALMTCAVVAFPHWAPAAHSEAPAADHSAACTATRPYVRKTAPAAHRPTPEPPRLVASN